MFHDKLSGLLGSVVAAVVIGRLSAKVGRLPEERLGESRRGLRSDPVVAAVPAWRSGGALRGTVDRSLGVEGSPAALLDDSSSAASLLGGILEFRTLDYDMKEISQ